MDLLLRRLWDFVSPYPLDFSATAETLGTLRKSRFSDSQKIPSKVVHTTCLLLQNKISYLFPGVAQLVARVVWDHQAAGSNPVTRTKTPLKPLVSGEFLLCKKATTGYARGLKKAMPMSRKDKPPKIQ